MAQSGKWRLELLQSLRTVSFSSVCEIPSCRRNVYWAATPLDNTFALHWQASVRNTDRNSYDPVGYDGRQSPGHRRPAVVRSSWSFRRDRLYWAALVWLSECGFRIAVGERRTTVSGHVSSRHAGTATRPTRHRSWEYRSASVKGSKSTRQRIMF